jgi:hypothetical protein
MHARAHLAGIACCLCDLDGSAEHSMVFLCFKGTYVLFMTVSVNSSGCMYAPARMAWLDLLSVWSVPASELSLLLQSVTMHVRGSEMHGEYKSDTAAH